MSSALIRAWFRTELLALEAAMVGDALQVPFVETNNANPRANGAALPPQFSTLGYMTPSNGVIVGIGQPTCRREEGGADIIVCVPAGVDADARACDVAERVRDWFRVRGRGVILADAPRRTLWTREPQPPITTDDADGRYYIAAINVPFVSDYFV